MFKKLIVITATALFAAAATAATTADVFATLDTDLNGSISMEEASVMPNLAEQWKSLDADANGELSAEEFAKFEAAESVSKG